jgi:hydroxymethylpyrimidine pyrophosphatase-like HAD family hydrolase
LAELHQVPLNKTLAMGDSTNDWTYMEQCGYVATLSNGESELKELIRTRKNDGFVSEKSIDQDGFVDALAFFGLSS